MENTPEIASVMPLVVSAMLTPVYVTLAVACAWPVGHLKVEGGGGGVSVREPVTFPFLPELNELVALTGPYRGLIRGTRVAAALVHADIGCTVIPALLRRGARDSRA